MIIKRFKISIITINRNNEIGLRKTIQSVIDQNYPNIEYIVIDGASTDGSVKVLNELNDKITFWISEEDNGIYNAMNKGIKKATGDYLLFLNSGDNLINGDIITEIVNEGRTEDLIYGNLLLHDAEKEWTWNLSGNLTFRDLYNSTIPHPTTFIKRELFDKVGFYDESLKIVSDWKFFLLAFARYNASYAHVNKIVTAYGFDGISSREENYKKIKEERFEVLRKEFGFFINDYVEFENLLFEMKNIKYLLKIRRFFKGLSIR